MTENLDILKDEEITKIKNISKENKLSMAAIGRACEINDRAFWHRIVNKQKPIPEHSRIALNNFLDSHKD